MTALHQTRFDGLHAWTGGPAGAPDVVLLHGWVVDGIYLLPLAERLAGSFRVHVIELPGHGRSPPEVPRDVPQLAERLREALDDAGLTRVHLVANSMGCQVAVALAAAHPQRVGRMVLMGPTLASRNPVDAVLRLLLTALREPLRLVLHVLGALFAFGPLRALRLGLATCRHRIVEAAPAVSAPVLVLRGHRDHLAPRSFVRALAEALPAGRLEELPWAAHAPHHEDPERTAARVAPFLIEEAPR